jgi:hypothetical protein
VAEALGVSVQNISSRIKTFLDKVKNYDDDELTFLTNHLISLNIEGSDRPVIFYAFSIFNFLAYRINTKESLLMINHIQQVI